MRDQVADPTFQLQKKIEARFSENYPDKWMPLYSQVSFSDIPYQEAWAVGQKQDAIMKEVMKMQNIEENWDSEEVEKKILSSLA